MLKIIIPIAGSSADFERAGYTYPKPIIEIKGKPMIELALMPLNDLKLDVKFIFVVREMDMLRYHINNTLKLLVPDCEIVVLKSETKGGLCSILMAIDLLHDDDSLLIMNGDQILNINFDEIIQTWRDCSADAGVVTFESVHPHWSYVLEEDGRIVQTAEKNPISNIAIAGSYYFKCASQFMQSAYNTIIKDNNLNGSFYISSVLNEYILGGLKISNFRLKNNNYYSFYSPQCLNDYGKV